MKFRKSLWSMALASAFAIGMAAAHAAPPAELVTNGPQVNPGDTSGWSPQQNRVESRRYEGLVGANPTFRAYRMRKECDPVTDPALHQQCIDSFSR